MPFMPYLKHSLVSLTAPAIVQKKRGRSVRYITDRENAYSIQVPGAYTIWVSDEHKTIQPVNYK